MSTTSKLVADMNDPEMNTLVIQTATAAGLRVNVDGKMLNDNYTNVMGSFPSLVRFARALLARQPAAIDKQAEAAWAVYWGIGEMRKNSVHFERETAEKVAAQIKSNTEIRPLYAAPLANEASKPAAPSVGQDERELIELLRNVCHYADSVCGMLRQGGWPGKAEALESRIKAVIDFDANSRDKETNLPCPICNGVEGCDHTVPERARAASTSANVAQGAAIAIRLDQIAEIANKYALGNPRLDALLGFVNEVIIVNGAEYAKSE
jgi:hypothetical protein